MMIRKLFALALATLFAGSADAQTLAYSEAYADVRDCGTRTCSGTFLDQQDVFGYDLNAQTSASAPGRGSAQASAAPGPAGSYSLPVLKVRSDVIADATAAGIAYGFQGYRNVSEDPLLLSFVGNLDFTGAGLGFVTPSIAILTSAVRDPEIGRLWVAFNNTNGGFVADCATPAAIAVVSGPINYGAGAQSSSIDTASGTCGGAGPATIAPGQEFYVLSRLTTYQYLTGSRDASHTFVTDISPLVAPDVRARLATALVPIALEPVPEPASWALLIVGFGAVGAAMRQRRRGRGRGLALA